MTREILAQRVENYLKIRGTTYDKFCEDVELTRERIEELLLRFYDDHSMIGCITLPEIGIDPEVFGIQEGRLLPSLPNEREGLLSLKSGTFEGMKPYIRSAFRSNGLMSGTAFLCIGSMLYQVRFEETENGPSWKPKKIKMTPRALAKLRKKERKSEEPAFILTLLDSEEDGSDAVFQIIR